MKRKYFSITADRMITPARITKDVKAWSQSTGTKVLRAKLGDASKIAIHLLEPEDFELEAAMERAERDNFPAIYLHTFKTWRVTKEMIMAEKKRKASFPALKLVVANG